MGYPSSRLEEIQQKLNNLPPYPWVAYPTSSQQNSFRLLKADCNQNKTYAIIQTQDPNLAKFLANAPSYIEYLLGLTASQDSVSLYSTTKESHGIG